MAVSRFDWPDVIKSTRFTLVASRVCVAFLDERREANQGIWSDPGRWRFGFYFGEGDTRLWVPRRMKNGQEDPVERVINFCHRRGRPAFRILMFAYGTGLALIIALVAALAGVRW
ncbi:MAG: hypothetical protein KF884_04410 [Fimbriimonadaceae bacterium]|nr:hypothetical protein [Fimbriimonadaceae bacterium]QYK59333.1 MAG: hypothetical protein KF884_04410 [Fimbriimonadaceae bacterium]